MFIGHFAVAFAAKKATPRLSLGLLFVSCQFLDFLWPGLVLAGVEHVRADREATAFTPLDFTYYPWSHSLGMSLVWAGLAYGVTRALRRSQREALVVALVLFSHWLLDLAAHRADLPLWFGASPKVGLGLWNSVPGTLLVEGGSFIAAVWLYSHGFRAKTAAARYNLWALIAILLAAYSGAAFGPKPEPDTPPAMLAGPALAMSLFVVWAAWIDKRRTQGNALANRSK